MNNMQLKNLSAQMYPLHYITIPQVLTLSASIFFVVLSNFC